MNHSTNVNTGAPWNPAEDFCWENPRTKFYGLRNPRAEHNRILFITQERSDEILVCWVNIQQMGNAEPYVNRQELKTASEARHLWNCQTHPNQQWIRDDSVPPRYAQPKAKNGRWEMPDYSAGIEKKMSNYALEA